MLRPHPIADDLPDGVATSLADLRVRRPSEQVLGVLAHSPAAANALAAFHQSFALQTRLSPQLRWKLRLAVAVELGSEADVDAIAHVATDEGVTDEEVQRCRTAGDLNERDASVMTLVRGLARGHLDDQAVAAAESRGWSARELVEAIVIGAETVLHVWLSRAAEAGPHTDRRALH